MNPSIDAQGWELVERGLREWFICCAWRGSMVLGMPSRAVDDAWHAFILDSEAYFRFCLDTLGGYLHHTPDETVEGTAGSLAETVRAWDRSEVGSRRESVLWELDAQLGIDDGLGVDPEQLHAARSRIPYAAASGWIVGGAFTESLNGGVRGAGGGDWGRLRRPGCGGGGT